jgi:transcriptional regulator with XRE-family HTH domain
MATIPRTLDEPPRLTAEAVAHALVHWRKSHGLNQALVARAAGLSLRSLLHCECGSGKTSLSSLSQLLYALRCDLSQLQATVNELADRKASGRTGYRAARGADRRLHPGAGTHSIPLDQLGPALRYLRRRSGLTREQAATAARSTPAQIGNYEAGRHIPRLETLCRLLVGLDCDLADLHHAFKVEDPLHPR